MSFSDGQSAVYTPLAEWEQKQVRSIRELLRRRDVLLREVREVEAKRCTTEIDSLLEGLCKAVDVRLGRFAKRYIHGGIVKRTYMAPIITDEELHAELRYCFIKEIKNLEGEGNLDWENSFLSALTFMSKRATRHLLETNGFDRTASSRIPVVSWTTGDEDGSSTGNVQDESSSGQLHQIEVEPALSSLLDAVTRELHRDASTDPKRRVADRRVDILKMILADAKQKQMANVLGASPRTVFDDITSVKNVAKDVMKRLGMIPADLLLPPKNT